MYVTLCQVTERRLNMAYQRIYEDYRLKAKRANQRMVELEKRGYKSPAYEAVQARLEMLGRSKGKAAGRRFSETGRATWQYYEQVSKVLDEFLATKTSTIGGYNAFYDSVWRGADQDGKLSAAGVTKDDYLEFWRNMPNSEKDRLYGSAQNIRIVQMLEYKGKVGTNKNQYTPAQIANIIQGSKNLKDVYKKLGISFKDQKKLKDMGALY